MSLFNISVMHLYNLFSLYSSQNFILNCLLSLIKLVIYIYKIFNSTLNWFKVNISIFNNLKNILNIICCLLDLYWMLKLNHYRYFKVYIKCKLSLFIENIINKVYLVILIKTL